MLIERAKLCATRGTRSGDILDDRGDILDDRGDILDDRGRRNGEVMDERPVRIASGDVKRRATREVLAELACMGFAVARCARSACISSSRASA